MGVKAVVGLVRSKLERNYLTIKVIKYYIVVLCQFGRSSNNLNFKEKDSAYQSNVHIVRSSIFQHYFKKDINREETLWQS